MWDFQQREFGGQGGRFDENESAPREADVITNLDGAPHLPASGRCGFQRGPRGCELTTAFRFRPSFLATSA